MDGSAGRAPRKDVARNRARLLRAAREVFAAHGLEATLDDIAQHAGVGAGTAYRHFGSRQNIVQALFSDTAESFITDAEHALTIDDPWTALLTFLETSATRQAQDRGLHQLFMGQHGTGITRGQWERLAAAITALLDRAKAAGAVRSDAELADVVALFAMLGPVYDLSTATSTELWRRTLAIYATGLRVNNTFGEPGTAPTLSATELGAALTVLA